MNSCQHLISAETPNFIAYADKPPRLGGKIENLALQEFQKRIGSAYYEGITKDVSTNITQFNESVTGYASSSELKKQVKNILNSSCFDKLVICNMGKFGYGVFASKDIPKSTVVATFAGTIIPGKHVKHETDYGNGYYGANMTFSTKYYRGIASFMQHLPEEQKFADVKTFSNILKMMGQDCSEEQLKLNIEMYSTKFTPANARKHIAMENIEREYLEFNNVPLIAMVTKRDIKSGEQLGFNYGYSYWLSRNFAPEYFDKNGNSLSHDLYKRTYGQLKFDDFSYVGEFETLVNSLKENHKTISLSDKKNKNYEISNLDLLCSLLNVNAIGIKIIDLSQLFNVLPNQIFIEDKGKTITSFNISNMKNQQSLSELRNCVGNNIFKKMGEGSTYVITKEWILQVNQVNPKGIELLVELFEAPNVDDFWLKINSIT